MAALAVNGLLAVPAAPSRTVRARASSIRPPIARRLHQRPVTIMPAFPMAFQLSDVCGAGFLGLPPRVDA